MTRITPLVVIALIAAAAPQASGSSVIAQAGDASIETDQGTGTYVLTAGGATLTLQADRAHDLQILKFTSASQTDWTIAARADSAIGVDGETLAFGSRSAGFRFVDGSVVTTGARLELDLLFDLAAAGLRFTRHYVVVPGAPAFETWTTVEGRPSARPISNLNALQLTVPNGPVHWVTGLRGDSADVAAPNPFTLRQRHIDDGDSLTLGSDGRSSQRSLPWLAIDGANDTLFVALLWSGAWTLSAAHSDAALSISIGLAPMSVNATDRTIEEAHAVFGVAPGVLADATAALGAYVLAGIRAGRPIAPSVTYNTWFTYGTAIDEPSMRLEMEHAAALGAELFVVDAGWYAGAGASGPMDFDTGLGSWTPDPARFPNGLAPLTAYAHDLGMKFGIWVEPERVNRSTVDEDGPDEGWLATHQGDYGSDDAAQICFAKDAARAWVLERLTSFLDAVQPDYLKWDNNLWVNCDRNGHGHGADDGNFAHVSGLYAVLQAIRDRYPALTIENVSGGGNRLDLGMMRYTDVAWMDDRTAPSVHVRHNVEGLTAIFPPGYLLSFVIDHDTEPLRGAPDLPLYIRSRMTGALGLCFRSAEFSDEESAAVAREIAVYKSYRDLLGTATGTLLSRQADLPNPPAWDVLQEKSADGIRLLVHAFQNDSALDTINVKPTGLDPDATYEVRSADAGVLGTASGADLMTNGIDLLESPASAAHLLFITVR